MISSYHQNCTWCLVERRPANRRSTLLRAFVGTEPGRLSCHLQLPAHPTPMPAPILPFHTIGFGCTPWRPGRLSRKVSSGKCGCLTPCFKGILGLVSAEVAKNYPRHLDVQIASINTTLLPQEARGTKNNETQVSI